MDRDHLEKAKGFLQELRESETGSALLKRAAVVAVVLGLIRSGSGMAAGADVEKLAKAIGPHDQKPMTGTPWADWNDWKDWKDWNDWSDWNDWNNWADWRDWTNWSDWKDWRDWADIIIPTIPTK